MTQTKTRKALLMSVLSMVLCVAMLVGMTFAWFTDTASTGVNKIVAGNLDVDIQDAAGNSLDGKTLSWQKATGHENEEVLWEPGASYNLESFKIVNEGNLALKYKVAITGMAGDAKLLEAIDFTITKGTAEPQNLENFEGMLIPTSGTTEIAGADKGETALYTIKGTMKKEANNDYQGLSIDGIGITVYATQMQYESDSNGNTYDQEATYPVANVSDKRALTAAVKNGGHVVLESDINLGSDPLPIPSGKDVTVDLNGKNVTTTGNFAVVAEGAKLTISGGTVNSGRYALRSEGGEIVVNGGNYISQETVCGVVKAGKLTINGGTFTSKDNCVVATNGNIENAGSEIIINGGTFNANIQTNGYIACGVYVANKDTVKINAGTFNVKNGIGVMMRAGNTTIGKDVVINMTSDGTVTAGKVADATIQINAGDYLVSDIKSGYPGLDDTFTIINNSKYNLVEYK